MRVMGVDPSTKTGVAVVEGGADLSPEVLTHSLYQPSSKKPLMERASVIAAQVNNLAWEYAPDFVVIEGYGFGNAHTLATLVTVGTLIRYRLWMAGQPYIEVPPNTLKKFVVGKGNAKKDEIMKEVYRHWGFEGSDDECDAVGLGMYGLACCNHLQMAKKNMEAVDSSRVQGILQTAPN